MDLDFSLVMATLGREREVGEFLQSAAVQTHPAGRFEIIVVDQNDAIDLAPLLETFRGRLDIVHLRIERRGLSNARNAGLDVAQGAIVAFPDDDCQYYPDTLAQALAFFQRHPEVDACHGRIVDRPSGRSIMRQWPDRELDITVHNAYFFASSITLFARRTERVVFDARFGLGARFGGYEDVEFTLRNVRAGHEVRYVPQIEVNHPQLNNDVMPLAKVVSYGMGFGALCRKHFSAPVAWLFVKAVGFHLLRSLAGLVRLRPREAVKGLYGAGARVWGLLVFSK